VSQFTALWRLPADAPERTRGAWVFWGVLFAVVAVVVASGSKRTVTGNYRSAAEGWVAGEPLYNDTGAGFLYLPQAAIVFAPFAQLPHAVGEILWRLLTVGVFVLGVRSLSRMADEITERPTFWVITLVSLPLAWSSARNGQSTLLMAGLMMLATASTWNRSWWRSAAWLTLAIAVKPLALVLALLVAALYPRTIGPLLVGLGLAAAAPFLTQSYDYVISQYRACGAMLTTAARIGQVEYWAQMFGMLKVFGLDVAYGAQTAIRLAAALLTLGLCGWAVHRRSSAHALLTIYALAACYLMLLNPRTENNTYSLAAPAMGVFIALESLGWRRRRTTGLLIALAVGTLGSFEIGKFFVPDKVQAVWLAPLCCFGFAIYLAAGLMRQRGEATPAAGQAADSAVERRRAA